MESMLERAQEAYDKMKEEHPDWDYSLFPRPEKEEDLMGFGFGGGFLQLLLTLSLFKDSWEPKN